MMIQDFPSTLVFVPDFFPMTNVNYEIGLPGQPVVVFVDRISSKGDEPQATGQF